MSERVLCIDDNEDALYWRLRLINRAQARLIISTFEWREDVSGLIIMAAVYAAAERGVKVRLFIDGLYGFLDLRDSLPFHALLSHPNVEVKFYNALNAVNLPKVNYRMHDKYLISDDKAFLLGGRNTYDYFLGDAPGRKNIDRELLVVEEGEREKDSALSQLLRYFFSIWAHPCNRKQQCKKSGEELKSGLSALQETAGNLQDQFPDAYDNEELTKDTLPTEKITLLSNPQENSRKEPILWHEICACIKGGKKAVIQSPYVICGKEMYQDLADVCKNTEEVDILLNAVENGANPWGCTDYLNQKENILQSGATVCEFIGDRSVHTKTVLIDDNISIVGSYNMDMRSTYLDTELMLEVKSCELNRELTLIAEEQIMSCRRVSPDGSYTDGPDYQEKDMPEEKRHIYALMRVLTRFEAVRGLL